MSKNISVGRLLNRKRTLEKIQEIEKRISDLTKDIYNTSTEMEKILKRDSLKASKKVLQNLKEYYTEIGGEL